MLSTLAMGSLLVVGLGLALYAGHRGWAPPLWATLCLGAGLRLAILLLAVRSPVQPWDLTQDFPHAADLVLDGRNPTTYAREGGWNFLPLLAYVLAGQRALEHWLGLPWGVVGRLVPVLADIALIPLVGRLAAQRRSLRSFQYACAPLGLMVSGIHGQFPPITLLFAVAALLAARGHRAHRAGTFIGLSLSCTSWAVLIVPGMLLTLPGTRRRVTALAWAALVPAAILLSATLDLDTPLGQLPDTAKTIASTRPVVGDWGWTAVATGGDQAVSPALGRIGTLILLIALLAAGWWWRHAEPVALTVALLLIFLVVTYRLGAQYLAWPMPFLIAQPTRRAWAAIIAASLWAAVGYLGLTQVVGMDWQLGHTYIALASLAVIPFLIRALPPRTPTPASGVHDDAPGETPGRAPGRELLDPAGPAST